MNLTPTFDGGRADRMAKEVTSKEAAKILGENKRPVSDIRIRQLIAQGRIEGARKKGGTWLLDYPVVLRDPNGIPTVFYAKSCPDCGVNRFGSRYGTIASDTCRDSWHSNGA